ncbi:MAG TPA: RIO1 family regulatory kinase/ATPase [Halococcus sp.]|nr:RIO1 family regulatory kinase/ATPase [Halococcus sp.]
MAFRRFVRGRIEWPRIEAVCREVAARYGERVVRVEFLDADNWLSTPCVVNEHWFVKIITPQNALVHALLTAGRNLGAVSSGTAGFFERFDSPIEMAVHELDATRKMREIGVNAPEPLEAFAYDEFGVLVLEYLPEFRTLDELSATEARSFAPDLFRSLARMHEASLGHGDLRAENVLVAGGELYFIDATSVRADAAADVRAYDLACALAALEPKLGAREAVDRATEHYSVVDLRAASEFFRFISLRPDHDFDAALLYEEIEKRTAD